MKNSVKGERADGTKIDAGYTAKYDGKEVVVMGTNLTFDTIAIKQVNPNTLTEEAKKGGTYRSSVRTVVSADGKTMTVTQKGTTADGKALNKVTVGVNLWRWHIKIYAKIHLGEIR